MKPNYKLTIFALLLLALQANAQLAINAIDPITAASLVMGPNVNVSNASYTGDTIQMGWADNIPAFPTNGGVVLSTSHIQNFYPGSAQGEPTTPVNTEDDLLSIANSVPPLIGQAFTVADVNDVAILEFDFVAPSAYMNLNFVYGSDEYLTYVNSQYNDVFAILISGPGITGPYASPPAFPDGSANLGIVPNSNPPLPITISSINNILNSEYYIDNPGNTNNSGVSLTGYTSIISSAQALIPGATYHLKLAIADGSDNSLKSLVIMNTAIFASAPPVEMCASILEESICLEDSVQLTTIPIVMEGVSFDNGIYIPDNQGCFETEVTFTEFGDAVIDDVSDINRIYLNMEHSYVGDLYINVICPDSSVMSIFAEVNASSANLGIPDQMDNGEPGIGYDYSFSPLESQTWMDYVNNGGTTPIPSGSYAPDGAFTDLIGCPLNGTWRLEICDIVGGDDGFVFEFGVLFSGTALPNTLTWSTGETSPTITVSPDETTTYYLYSETNEGLCIDSVTVYVVPPVQISTEGPAILCNDNVVVLTASGADSYLWNTGSTSSQLDVTLPGVYTVTGTTASCVSEQTIEITSTTEPVYLLADSTAFCSGDTVTIFTPANLINYFWNNGATGNTIEVAEGGDYFVAGTDLNGCNFSSEIITINEYFFDNSIASSDNAICNGEPVMLEVNPQIDSIQWNNGATTPDLIVTEPGTYYALLTNGPCEGYTQSIVITEGVTPNVAAFALTDTLCNDGSSTLLFGTPTGGTWEGDGITNNEFSSTFSGTGNFELTYNYTNPQGCSASASEIVTVIVCTDVTETEILDRYTIFPNPFNNYFQIQHPGGSYFSIELFDASGKLIYSSVARENIRIATDFIKPGMYTIRIIDEDSSRTYPLVKMN